MSKIGIIFLCLLGLIPGEHFVLQRCSQPQEDGVTVALRQISPDDQIFLDYFFRELLIRDSGAYVLNGTKPAMWNRGESSSELTEFIFYGMRFFKKVVLFQKGYETWRKYQHLFPFANYAFVQPESREKYEFDILLVNKKQFIQEVSKNIEDIRIVLGSEITPEILLKRCLKGERSILEVLANHSALLGMILGFGRHNSWLFHERESIMRKIDESQFVPKKFSLIEKELSIIHGKFQSFDPKKKRSVTPLFVSLPGFVYEAEHPETKQLFAKYEKERKQITKYYQQGSFLEIALRRLIS